MDGTQKLAHRISEIIRRLYAGETLQRDALVAEFAVSERTIFRDLNRLSDWMEADTSSGYRLQPRLKHTLQPQQVQALVTLLDMHELFPGDMLTRLTRQMDAPGDEPSYLFRAPNSEMDGVNRQDFAQLDQATQQRLVCQLRYRGKARTVQPYRLINQQGVWYVAVVEAGTLKAFALSQCSHVLVTDERFAPDPACMHEIAHSDGIWFGPSTTVTLHVSGLAMEYFKRRQQVPHQTIVQELASYLVVTTQVRHSEQLLPTLRYWIPHVRIVDQPDYADALNRSLEQFLQLQAA